jgi:hypothetical protein
VETLKVPYNINPSRESGHNKPKKMDIKIFSARHGEPQFSRVLHKQAQGLGNWLKSVGFVPEVCFTSEHERSQQTLETMLRVLFPELGEYDVRFSQDYARQSLLGGKLHIVQLAGYASPGHKENFQCIQKALETERPSLYPGRVLSVTHDKIAQEIVELFLGANHDLLKSGLDCGYGIALDNQRNISVHGYQDVEED